MSVIEGKKKWKEHKLISIILVMKNNKIANKVIPTLFFKVIFEIVIV